VIRVAEKDSLQLQQTAFRQHPDTHCSMVDAVQTAPLPPADKVDEEEGAPPKHMARSEHAPLKQHPEPHWLGVEAVHGDPFAGAEAVSEDEPGLELVDGAPPKQIERSAHLASTQHPDLHQAVVEAWQKPPISAPEPVDGAGLPPSQRMVTQSISIRNSGLLSSPHQVGPPAQLDTPGSTPTPPESRKITDPRIRSN
jgi:hypothetical protein